MKAALVDALGRDRCTARVHRDMWHRVRFSPQLQHLAELRLHLHLAFSVHLLDMLQVRLETAQRGWRHVAQRARCSHLRLWARSARRAHARIQRAHLAEHQVALLGLRRVGPLEACAIRDERFAARKQGHFWH